MFIVVAAKETGGWPGLGDVGLGVGVVVRGREVGKHTTRACCSTQGKIQMSTCFKIDFFKKNPDIEHYT